MLKASVHHARMRMGLSALNAHRRKYNFICFNNCPLCGIRPEDSLHFFLKCPYHAIHRARLVEHVYPIVSCKIPDLVFYPVTKNEFKDLVDLYLHGSLFLTFEENAQVFKAVHTYILDTKRFDMA